MRIGGDEGELAIERVDVGPAGTPGEGDVLLGVAVTVRGYAASERRWVLRQDWGEFIAELRRLEATRRGRAVLRGASDELRIEVFATDGAGHVAVRGEVRRRTPDGFDLGLVFGFAIESDRLGGLRRDLEALSP